MATGRLPAGRRGGLSRPSFILATPICNNGTGATANRRWPRLYIVLPIVSWSPPRAPNDSLPGRPHSRPPARPRPSGLRERSRRRGQPRIQSGTEEGRRDRRPAPEGGSRGTEPARAAANARSRVFFVPERLAASTALGPRCPGARGPSPPTPCSTRRSQRAGAILGRSLGPPARPQRARPRSTSRRSGHGPEVRRAQERGRIGGTRSNGGASQEGHSRPRDGATTVRFRPHTRPYEPGSPSIQTAERGLNQPSLYTDDSSNSGHHMSVRPVENLRNRTDPSPRRFLSRSSRAHNRLAPT